MDGRVVNFGASGYEDFTTHKDRARMERYTKRHAPTEDWTKKGLSTPGFWAKHLLWNKPSLDQSIKDVEGKFGVKIIKKKSDSYFFGPCRITWTWKWLIPALYVLMSVPLTNLRLSAVGASLYTIRTAFSPLSVLYVGTYTTRIRPTRTSAIYLTTTKRHNPTMRFPTLKRTIPIATLNRTMRSTCLLWVPWMRLWPFFAVGSSLGLGLGR